MIRLGAQGWNYDAWVGPFYPEGTRPAEYLRLYARAFGTIEVDATFYAIPPSTTIRGWAARVPADFEFALKLPGQKEGGAPVWMPIDAKFPKEQYERLVEAAGLTPETGEVLVTGAAGGVGTIATSLLAKLGYEVAALSGRPQHAEALKALGAGIMVDREEFLAQPDKPLESARWAAVIDNVGGKVLGKALKQVKYGGSVASIGNAGGIELSTNVLPFILRGISLFGIDSVMQPYAARVAAWQRIAGTFDLAAYAGLVREIGLEELPGAAREILAGEVKGRVLVKVG